jgi:transcriptional regulator with XRE-family HTH domain
MTQKQLGIAIGFRESTADVRIAQYETGTRTPKAEVTATLAHVLGVSPLALTVPDTDNYFGLMHTLFALEDLYGLQITELDGECCIRLNREHPEFFTMRDMFLAWKEQAQKLKSGEISEEYYNHWRYTYSEESAKEVSRGIDALRKVSEYKR